MRLLATSLCLTSVLLLSQATAFNLHRRGGYQGGESCTETSPFCIDDATLGICDHGKIVSIKCSAGTKCSEGDCGEFALSGGSNQPSSQDKYGPDNESAEPDTSAESSESNEGSYKPSQSEKKDDDSYTKKPTEESSEAVSDAEESDGASSNTEDEKDGPTSKKYGDEVGDDALESSAPSYEGKKTSSPDATQSNNENGGESEDSEPSDMPKPEDEDDSYSGAKKSSSSKGGYNDQATSTADDKESSEKTAGAEDSEEPAGDESPKSTGSASEDEGYTGGGDVACTSEEFNAVFQGTDFKKPDSSCLKDFLQAAIKDGGVTSKRELAMFLAQSLHESDGFHAMEEYACKDTGCPGEYGNTGSDPDKMYFGRGYIQLTWKDNYEECSKDLYGDDRLVQNPDMVAKDQSVAWATAAWYWKSHVHKDATSGKFGLTTKAINGALECGKGEVPNALKRFKIYETIYKAFKLPGKPDPSGCY
ncbi:MAG: lysozyme-like domain-containing protein [Piptocephalis tieghemiana]|nr:MAG: lysozyme-like domain-containing protein [Piptocephalis tieghemiana]